jgi:hypothetical protein
MNYKYIFIFSALFFGACRTEETLPPIGQNIAGPVDVDADESGQYFYVLNSDFERRFGEGSILIVTTEGEKLKALTTPRMGRILEIIGSQMLVAYDRAEPGEDGKLELYDISDPRNPVLHKVWDFECAPLNVVGAEGYSHFAVSCGEGYLYVGTLKSPLAQSDLKKVRGYEVARRALYIDVKRELIFAFPTDLGAQNIEDARLEDKLTYDATGTAKAGANEIPDAWEEARRGRDYRLGWYPYQLAIYDIKEGRDAKFPYKSLDKDDDTAEEVQAEHRWIYFVLNSLDGTPDSDDGILNPATKNYRTNFWEAKPYPGEDDSFLVSQRGVNASVHANNVIKVTITGDVKAVAKGEGKCAAGYTTLNEMCVPNMETILEFDRVYGFTADKSHYPGSFETAMVNGQTMLMVNHFKEPYYFQQKDRSYAIAAALLDDGLWTSELKASAFADSYYQIAINEQGRAITCVFYGDAVLLMDIFPGTDIKVVKRIY